MEGKVRVNHDQLIRARLRLLGARYDMLIIHVRIAVHR